MKRFNNLPVRLKITFTLAAIFAVTCSSYLVMLYYNSAQKTTSATLDLAGRNRMLSQRIGMMALLTDTDDEAVRQTATEELRKAVALHEQSLHILKNGGSAPGFDGEVLVKPAPEHIVQKINETEAFFKNQKALAEAVISQPRKTRAADSTAAWVYNPPYKEALDMLRQHLTNGTLLKLNVEITQLYTQHADRANASFYGTLMLFFMVNLAVLAGAFGLLSFIFRPIVPVTQTLVDISDGKLPESLPVRTKDEIGRMSESVNLLISGLANTVQFAKTVGNGDYATDIPVFGGKGDLSTALHQMRDSLRKNAAEDARRNWAAEGISRFTDILRSTADPKPLCEKLLSELTHYTKSVQGSVYVAEYQTGDQAELRLMACYAFNRKKFLEKTLLAGEGIVGQAFLERQTLHLTEIPAGLTIPSGLGEAPPRSLLVVPLISNEVVLGVLELASFNEYHDHEIGFVERLAENIAATLQNARINQQTNRLLTESREQAEEMRAQEEEMRQNMEELAATQEEMLRKEREYVDRISWLEDN
ncbi:MAG: GAF domain-containing protein [Cytophagales bacterium]|nr:GAF domain-containing protein [Cytophagales bacterium]